MKRLALEYARKRLRAFIAQIVSVTASEFPYPLSKDALDMIKKIFEMHLELLVRSDLKSDPQSVTNSCAVTLRDMFRFLPVLGFILRSTNVRNAFEVYGPLLALAGDLLEPDQKKENRSVRLIISSEWEYSPYVYKPIKGLPGYALIGLPAPESANPLLIPSAGHELGHLVWERKRLEVPFRTKLKDGVLGIIDKRRDEWERYFPDIPTSKDELEGSLFARLIWTPALDWASRQCQETFSDFVGLRIFGASYFHSFAHLFSPNLSGPRSPYYPKMRTRVQNLLEGARFYGIHVQPEYELMFEDSEKLIIPEEDSEKPIILESEEFRLSLADQAASQLIPELIDKANETIGQSSVPPCTDSERDRIYDRLKLVVPAEECKCLADILNAGWKAYTDDAFWRDNPQVFERKDEVLKDLILKNIEVFQFEESRSKS